MFNSNGKLLTVSNILESVSELEIINYYFDNPDIGKTISSPIRDDAHPSFSFFKSNQGTNQYMWKDFATGESGNVFTLLSKLYYNLTFKQVLEKINLDFELNLISDLQDKDFYISNKKNVKYIKDVKYSKPKASIITPKFIKWTKHSYRYWNQYQIKLEQLKYYKVNPIQYALLNRDKKVFKWQSDSPKYAYSFKYKNTIKYKLYAPLETKYKWLTNTNNEIIQGLPQAIRLRTTLDNKLLFVTSSLKDVMVINKLGYLAIAPQSENQVFTFQQFDFIYKYFDKLILWFDSDEAGKLSTKKFISAHDTYYFTEKFVEKIFIPENYNVKDPSDFICKYGKDELQILTDSLI